MSSEEQWKEFQKEELHKASLSAFIQNGIEQDKVLLSLNIASIGFFINFLLKFELETKSDLMIFFIVIVSMMSFLISAASILGIFNQNKKYLLKLLKGNFENDKLLGFLDKTKLIFFIVGVIFGIIFSIFTIIGNSNIKENKVKEVNKSIVPQKVGQKSLNDLASHITVGNDSKKTDDSSKQLASHLQDDNKSSNNKSEK